ncbi:hypothetical protein [Streptomyces sp. NPDC002265]|uniref:hypothetical protein n=1 Tax=Streptomyces sp. NPDC002265 TaxID=3154415 RepID=UPI0033349110
MTTQSAGQPGAGQPAAGSRTEIDRSFAGIVAARLHPYDIEGLRVPRPLPRAEENGRHADGSGARRRQDVVKQG